ncbi:MAG: yhcVH [bacterium]|nr:MAG: yhcVH [bacterium]
MSTVNQLLRRKSSTVYSVTPDTTVFDALTLMAEKEIGVVVVLENQKLVGTMSERDYARKIILKGKSSKETFVHEIMADSLLIIEPGTTVQECMSLMTDTRMRHLPVVSKGDLVGLVSIGDVVKYVIDEQEFMIKQLEAYITT